MNEALERQAAKDGVGVNIPHERAGSVVGSVFTHDDSIMDSDVDRFPDADQRSSEKGSGLVRGNSDDAEPSGSIPRGAFLQVPCRRRRIIDSSI